MMFSAAGVGYYHILTKDAYQIIEVRLEKKRDEQIDRLARVDCCEYSCALVWCCTDIKRKEASKVLEISDKITVMRARRNAAQPVGDLDLPTEVVERNQKRSSSNHANPHTTTYNDHRSPIFDQIGVPYDCFRAGRYVFQCIFEIVVLQIIVFSNLMKSAFFKTFVFY